MVKIVTGKINSFKTTRLEAYFQKNKVGDGFIAKKVMKDNLVLRYDLVRLSDQLQIPYIVRESLLRDEKVIYKIGPYCFLESAFNFVESEVKRFIREGISPVYLDEISLLELDDLGYHSILKELLAENIDLVLVIREDLLEKVLAKYEITEFQLLR